MVAAGVLAALVVAYTPNPSQDSLNKFLTHRTSGNIVASLARTFSKETYTRSILYSEASAGGDRFVGIFGFWFEDPRALMLTSLSACIPKIVELLAIAFVAVYLRRCTLSYRTIQTHFKLLTRRGIFSAGRWYTALTVAFRSQAREPPLCSILYVLAALCKSVASLAGHPSGDYCSLGASGALFGLSGYFAATASEHHQVLLYGFAMSPAQALLANFALSAGLVENRSGTDNWMHFGGAFAGAVLFPWALNLRLSWL